MDTVIADDRRRVTMPEGIVSPGDRFDVSKDSMGRIVLRRLKPTPEEIEKIPLVKMKIGKDGLPCVNMPGVTSEMVARAVREERDSR